MQPPHTSYLICATQRSGSTLLCEIMTNTRIAGQPEEYFQAHKETDRPRSPLDYFEGIDTRDIAPVLGDSSQPGEKAMQLVPGESYPEYLAKILKRGTTPNGVFGAKVMWAYFDGLIRNLQQMPQYRELAGHDLLSTVFPNLHYIWITRRDKVRQAVSLWKALQTWNWREDEPLLPNGEPSHELRELLFHYEAIDHLLQQIVSHELAWQQYFNNNGISPMIVVYEELTGAYEEAGCNILQYLQIPIPEHLAFTERRMKRQADALSEEWVRHYHLFKCKQETYRRNEAG